MYILYRFICNSRCLQSVWNQNYLNKFTKVYIRIGTVWMMFELKILYAEQAESNIQPPRNHYHTTGKILIVKQYISVIFCILSKVPMLMFNLRLSRTRRREQLFD